MSTQAIPAQRSRLLTIWTPEDKTFWEAQGQAIAQINLWISVPCLFLAFAVFTSSPFTRLDPAPFQGASLNPLLQDPALAVHPPLLYAGYVGFSVCFSLAVAALIEGRAQTAFWPAWGRWVRQSV